MNKKLARIVISSLLLTMIICVGYSFIAYVWQLRLEDCIYWNIC